MISDDLRRELNTPAAARERTLTTPAKPSVAQVLGHALHPILVTFPITLYAIATACFIAYAVNAEAFWFRAAFYASFAGVIAAVVAAIPGIIDYFGSIPAKDPAKKVGRTHMAFNTLSLVLFAVISYMLWDVVTPDTIRTERFDATTPMWLSILGLASTLVAGYFGGSLVQQHHVGIEPSPRRSLTARKAQPSTI